MATATTVVESPPDEATIEAWLRSRIAAVIELNDQQISVHKPVAAFGIDSVEAAGLIGDAEEWLGQTLPQELIWEWASVREIAQSLSEHLEGSARSRDLGDG